MVNITNIKKIRADLYDNSVIVVRAKQYDKSTRYLNITCTDDGDVVPIHSDEYRALIKVITPDGRNIHDTAIINDDDGTITVELTDSILHTAGSAYFDINLYSKEEEALLSSMTIKLVIARSVYDDGREINSDEFSALTDLIAETVKSENDRMIAENERASSEEERKANELERQANETIRQDDENSRKNAENARINNERNRVTEFNNMLDILQTTTSDAEKVNISSTEDTDCYTVTITNRKGESTISQNLKNKLSIGTVTTSGSGAEAQASIEGDFGNQKLNLVLPQGRDGGKGFGFYRYEGELADDAITCLRTNILPKTDSFYEGENIIDQNGTIFTITKQYNSGNTISIKRISGLIDYMTVEEFDAIFEE